ncbi:hypothetical protein C1646_143228 [Rhizophagus diaphanus]|nr:hypothetical protein C1646_143228 [Rhizophagus diaphanus] [Rhizophagus sp. MUCL 43196]
MLLAGAVSNFFSLRSFLFCLLSNIEFILYLILLSRNSKGYGFISYDKFDSSNAAIDTMNVQYLNKTITVSCVFKKDGKRQKT